MATAAQTLAEFVANLKCSDIPTPVAQRAKDCMADTAAACTFGAQLPWSRMVAQYAQRYGSGGKCSILGIPDARIHTPYAALANGVFAHAFEQDSVRDPGIGGHPGAALMPAVLAASEEAGTDGQTAVAAFVAGCEVMFRIGLASHHSRKGPEQLGFHAPGLTGPYGAAVAAGRVFGLNSEQMTNALGIAGSLSSGLLAFSKSAGGAMVKRLHLGRAAESGILAARLASAGYSGPETILEGKFGFLDAYCEEGDPQALTSGLHERWETLRICMKRYSCHMRAQIPTQGIRDMMDEHAFNAKDVNQIVLEGSKKLLTHHNILEPADLMQAQYSVPFCVALALFRDPENPRSFDETTLQDTEIRNLCRNVQISERTSGSHAEKSTHISLRLGDGRVLEREATTYKGLPDNPLTRDELRRKFMLLAAGSDASHAERIFEQIQRMEELTRFSLS